jgi:hypothetical protein
LVNGTPNVLFSNIESKEIQGYIEINISRGKGKEGRKAKLSIRYGEVELCPPIHWKSEKLSTRKINAILVKEIEVPSGEKGVSRL